MSGLFPRSPVSAGDGDTLLGSGPVQTAAAADDRVKTLESHLQHPNVQAFLSMIAQAEGATYNTRYGGGTFSAYSKFPGYGRRNTASGRYQIVADTYKGLSR